MTFDEQLKKTGKLIYTNVGTSMMPLIRERKDILVIEACDVTSLKKYDVVLYTRPDGKGSRQYVLHRILKVNSDGSYWIVGDHCVTGERVEQSQILGLLTCLVRDGKQITDENLRYRCYVHLWCDFYPIRCFLLIVKGKLLYHLRKWKKNLRK